MTCTDSRAAGVVACFGSLPEPGFPSYTVSANSDRIISFLRKSIALDPDPTYEITLTNSWMSSDRLKVESSATVVTFRTVVFCYDKVKIDDEVKASTSAGSLAGNRPAYRGPSLCQCWGRWTQEAEPAMKVRSESESTEMPEH